MKNLIISGAGGMGRQVYLFAKACTGYQKEYIIKGFLDDNPNAMVGFNELYLALYFWRFSPQVIIDITL